MSTRLRIVSDGTPQGTKILTEDGQMVRNVQLVSWHLAIGGNARCTLEVYGMAADVIGLVEHEDSSMLEDPTAIPHLTDPQSAPEGPGFDGYPYECPACRVPYRDGDMVCAGTEDRADHPPVKVVPREP